MTQISLLRRQLQHKEKEVQQMKQKLYDVNQVLRKCDKTQKTLMNRIRRHRSTHRLRVENSLLQSRQLLQTVFNSDQIQWLQSKPSRRRAYKWSKPTIKKALRIRFSCTNSGYQELIKQNIPLPSTRTLRESLEGFNFSPGILSDIFYAMKEKVLQFEDDRQRDCILGIDEMSLTPGEQPDPSATSTVGLSTIPNNHGNS
ncbi:uncharacterized protein LOC105189341 [Harpegnathos saltator]|uniref:uncharacterized protein LOC105189341 n=1 Tax=Harpegnathos saltator TaxID=610380 RepID=UPI00058AFFA3|nr:uncharacterized protein LOC105189341 [Harpegnathos saltator]